MSLNITKANTLNDKLYKCYSQIGLCTDENILFGKSSVDKESHFLSLLTVFIKNLHLAENESLNNDNTIINVEKENLNVSDNIQDQISTKKENRTESKKEEKSKEFSDPLSVESFHEKFRIDIDKLCLDIEEIKKEYNNGSHKTYEQSLQNFNSSFKNVSSLSTQSTQTNSVSKVYSEISSDLQDMHFTFLTVNKTLSNKTKIKNQPTLENSMAINETLTSVIKDNLVLVEQACNTFVED